MMEILDIKHGNGIGLEQTIESINADLRELTDIYRKRSEELDHRARFEEKLDGLRASVNERHNPQVIHSLGYLFK